MVQSTDLINYNLVKYSIPDTIAQNDTVFLSSNIYRPNGNLSAQLAIDSALFGKDKFFKNKSQLLKKLKSWIWPFEKKFEIKLHFSTYHLFTPEENDSLFLTLEKLYVDIPWTPTYTVNDPNLDKNEADILIAIQEEYNTGRNHANAILGNALIFAYNQPAYWTTRQLIFIHELAHLFGGVHEAEGEVPTDWYGNASKSIMDYEDLAWMRIFGFDMHNLPIDDHNYYLMMIENQTANGFSFPTNMYRFDQNDPDQDSMPNWFEYQYGLNATSNDTIKDKDSDGLKNIEEWVFGTKPDKNDTDSDGFLDGIEVEFETSPLDPNSYPTMITPPSIRSLNSSLEDIWVNVNFNLAWKASSPYQNYYEILKNGSKVYQNEWTENNVIFTTSISDEGVYNYSCTVFDRFGQKASSYTIVIIKRSFDSSFTSLFLLVISLIFLSIVKKGLKLS